MAYPTKLPGGRLVLTLDPQQKAKAFELDMRRAVGRVDPTEGWLEAFFCATKPVAMVRVKGPPLQYEFLRLAGPDRLGYEPADFGSDGNVSWMAQEAALGLKYAVVPASRHVENETQLAIAITSTGDGDNPLALGRKRVASALDFGYDELFESHCAWWEEFWSISSVSIPNERIQRHYNLAKYFYGAASRPNSPPIPLHGVWTRDDATRWRDLRGQLDDLLVDDQNVLMYARGEPFNQSHRHHSQAMAIHPLGTLNMDGTEADRAVIDAALDRIHKLGTPAWCGYSFSWFSCMLARCGRADMALDYLIDYERAFILRNGFHANGDQIGAGLSNFCYRPFTLEGNFLAMQAVREMLLQSWGRTVRVFPAASDRWADVSFTGLRTEGGFKVSGKRIAGQTTEVRIEATVDGPLRLRDPFDGATAEWNRPSVRRDGDDYFIALKVGNVLTGRCK